MFFITGIGYGDSVREYAVIQKLKELEDVDITIVGYNCSYKFFKDKFPTIKIKGFKTEGMGFEFSSIGFLRQNYTVPLFQVEELLRLRKEVRKFNPDLIISDFEPLGMILAKICKKDYICVFGVSPTDFKAFLKSTRLNIFTGLQVKYLQSMYNLARKAKAMIIPTFFERENKNNIHFINPVIRTEPEKFNEKIPKSKKTYLVTLGGSSFGSFLGKRLFSVLDSFKEKFILVGYPYKFKADNVLCLPFTEDIEKYIAASKGVISLAGYITISEALVYRKPMLLFPITNHIEQQYNAYMIEREGLGIARDVNEIDEEFFKKSLEEFFKKEKKIQKEIDSLQFENNGAEQAAKIILKVLKKVKKENKKQKQNQREQKREQKKKQRKQKEDKKKKQKEQIREQRKQKKEQKKQEKEQRKREKQEKKKQKQKEKQEQKPNN